MKQWSYELIEWAYLETIEFFLSTSHIFVSPINQSILSSCGQFITAIGIYVNWDIIHLSNKKLKAEEIPDGKLDKSNYDSLVMYTRFQEISLL